MILVETFLKALTADFMLHACTRCITRLVTGDNKAHIAILALLIGAVYAMRCSNIAITPSNVGIQMFVAIFTVVDIMVFTTARTEEILVTHFVARMAIGLVNAVTTIATMMMPVATTITTFGTIATVLAEVFGYIFFCFCYGIGSSLSITTITMNSCSVYYFTVFLTTGITCARYCYLAKPSISIIVPIMKFNT